MERRFIILCILPIVLFSACSKKETIENPDWEIVTSFPHYSGWPGGIVTDKTGSLFIAIGPDQFLSNDLGAAGGILLDNTAIFRSSDNGKTWKPFSSGIPRTLRILSIAGSHDGTLYARTLPVGIYRLKNGDSLWTSISDAETSAFGIGARSEIYYGAFRKGNFRSSDQGQTWENITGDLPPSTTTSIGADSSGAMMLMTVFSGGFCSTNNGKTWDSVKTSRILKHSMTDVSGILSSGHSFTVFNRGRVEKTADLGKSWNKLTDGSLASLYMVNDSTFYGGLEKKGVLRSAKKGENWLLINRGMDTPARVTSIGKDAAGTIYAGTDKGIYRLIRPVY
jgi:photosystem II stability/assembly factor-like uncharacterized protein